MIKFILSICLAAGVLFAQTTINGGRTILGNWDASGASTTKPFKSGTSLPSTCAVGEVFFDTDATAGQNVFGCTATNTWTAQGSSGSGGLSTTIDPAYIRLADEFGGDAAVSVGLYTGNGMRWQNTCNGSSCGIWGLNGTWPNLGTVKLQTGTTSGNLDVLIWASTIQGASLYANTDKPWAFYWVFKLGQTTLTTVRLGWSVGISSTTWPQGWFGLRYDTAASDTDFQFCMNWDTGTNCSTSGVSADTAFHTLKVRGDGTTNQKLYFSLDGGAEKTGCASGCDITSPDQTGVGYANQPFAGIATGEAAAKTLVLDYFGLEARASATAGRRQ